MPQREGGVLLRSRVANLRLKGVQQRMEQALVIAWHVVQGPAMPCSESSEGRISSSTPALGSSGRISGRASASFAASVLSHVFRSGDFVVARRLKLNCALVVWRSVAGEYAGDVQFSSKTEKM